MTTDPKFVPPLNYDVLQAVVDGRLKPLDYAVYCYLVSRVNWTPREADIRERFSIGSHTTYVAMLKRLRTERLIARGGKTAGNRTLPPIVSRSGVYERDLALDAESRKPGPKSGLHTYQQTYLSAVGSQVQKVDSAEGEVRPLGLHPGKEVEVARADESTIVGTGQSSSSKGSSPSRAFDCSHCDEPFPRLDKLSMHIFAEHRDRYDDFISELPGQKV